jgi:O-acetyl-ADP-ribose deacetylase (regulator of RNase III)
MKESRTIESVVLPAMGTGYGGVDFDEAARQMAVAYHHYLHPPGRPTWDTVIRREKAICYDGDQKVAVR